MLSIITLLSLVSYQGIGALDIDLDMKTNIRRKSSSKNESALRERAKFSSKNNPGNLHPMKQSRALPGRIIGGTDADKDEYPWFARGTYNNHNDWWGCGGSLVTEEFVLTAAHCEWDRGGGFQIGALCSPYGPSNSNNCGQKVERFDIDRVFKHPGYNDNTSNKDFALVRLSGRSTIPPVPMDTDDASSSYGGGEELWPSGLGNTFSGFPNHLKHVMVPYVTNSVCNAQYGGGITSAMMCAGDLSNGGEDSCQGDSGGPLYDKNNDILVGITSWGYGCAQRDYPGVYARVSDQWDSWIKPTICNNSNSPKPDFCSSTPTPPSPTPPSPTPPSPTPPSPTSPPPTPPSPTPPSPTPPSPTPPSPTPPTSCGSSGSGCCSQDFNTCVSWCGTTESACANCNQEVFWIDCPNQDCKPRYGDCTNDKNSCCDGLTCVEDNPFYSQCRYVPPTPTPPTPPAGTPAPTKKSTNSPTKRPSSHPTPLLTATPTDLTLSPTEVTSNPTSITANPTDAKEGCYSNNYKDCLPDGFTYESCDMIWLPTGAQNNCLTLWSKCEGESDDSCCGPAKCYGDSNNGICVPNDETDDSESPSTAPSSQPCIVCDDRPTGSMITNGLSCEDVIGSLNKRCGKDSWITKKFCQLSCYNTGNGYDGDVCCNGSI